MPIAPAVCDKCNTVFASGFNIAAENISLYGLTAGPCPSCGGLGSIPDGVYSALSETILAFKAGRINQATLQILADLLESARTTGDEPQEVAERIKSNVPELASVADALPKTRNELYAFLAVLVALLSVLINMSRSESRSHPHHIDIEHMEIEQSIDLTINNLYENTEQDGH